MGSKSKEFANKELELREFLEMALNTKKKPDDKVYVLKEDFKEISDIYFKSAKE